MGATVLVVLHVTLAVLVHGFQMPGLKLYNLFNLDGERNLPAWFGASLLLMNAMLLVVIAAMSTGAERRRWAVLAVFVVAASVDEAVSLHESLGNVLHEAFDTSGVLFFAWVVPVGIVVAVVGLAYL